LSLIVEREPMSSGVTIRPGKCRGAEVEPFAARYLYEHKPGTKELAWARFERIPVDGCGGEHALHAAILAIVDAHPGMPKARVILEVQNEMDDVGRERARRAIDALVASGRIAENKGLRNSKLLSKV
jgi:hypothetical protein